MVIYFQSTLLGSVKIANKKVIISPGSARQMPVIEEAWVRGRGTEVSELQSRGKESLRFTSTCIPSLNNSW